MVCPPDFMDYMLVICVYQKQIGMIPYSTYETIAYFYEKIVLKVKLLFLCDKLVSGPECLTLSESVPLAKPLMYMRVTLRPCTRPPGCTLDITQKTELAFRCFTQG